MTCWLRCDSRFHLAFGADELANKSILIRRGGFKIQEESADDPALRRLWNSASFQGSLSQQHPGTFD